MLMRYCRCRLLMLLMLMPAADTIREVLLTGVALDARFLRHVV